MGIKTKKILRLISKIVLIVIGLGLLGYVGYFVYRSIVFKPQNIVITNITDSSATITWTTKSPMKGIAYFKKDGSLLPGPLAIVNSNKAYDDRDVSDAQKTCVDDFNKQASETKDTTFTIDGSNYDCTNVKVTKVGDYYTHSVTMMNLDENSTYDFVVGNGIWSFKETINTVKTFGLVDSTETPSPIFGRVVGDDGSYSRDGLVYITFTDGSESKDSIVYSSTTNDDGGWYVDAANARTDDGTIMVLELTNDSFKASGLYKNYKMSDIAEWVLGYFNMPYPDIVVKKTIERSSIVGRVFAACGYVEGVLTCDDGGSDPSKLSEADKKYLQDNAATLGYGRVVKLLTNSNGGDVKAAINTIPALAGTNETANYNANAVYGTRLDGTAQEINVTQADNGDGTSVTVVTGTTTVKNPNKDVENSTVTQSCVKSECSKTTRTVYTGLLVDGRYVVSNEYNGAITYAACDSNDVCLPVTKDTDNGVPTYELNESRAGGYCLNSLTGQYVESGQECTYVDGSIRVGTCQSGSCNAKTPLSDTAKKVVFEVDNSNNMKITCPSEICTDSNWGQSLVPLVPEGTIQDGASTVTVNSLSVNPSETLMVAESANDQTTVDLVTNLISENNSYRGLAFTEMGRNITCLNTSNCPGKELALQRVNLLCPLLGGTVQEQGQAGTQCPGATNTVSMNNKGGLMKSVFAEESEKGSYVTYLPEYGMYSFQIGGYTLSKQISEGSTMYIFYIEANGEEGLQAPKDPNNPTLEEDIVLDSSTYQISYTQESTAQQYEIKKGINIISFNFMPVSTELGAYTAKDVITQASKNGVEIQYITTFDGGRWSGGYSCSSDTCTGTNFTIVPGKGYLVYATDDGTITIPGYNLESSIPVAFSAGWNLIGVHGYKTAYTARTLLDSINTISGLTGDNVSWWPTSKGKYEGLSLDNGTAYGLDFPISPTNGYFVRISKYSPEDTKCKSLIWQPGGTLNGTCGNTK